MAGSTLMTVVRSVTTAYLPITDRNKDVIVTGGENVSSIEVEDVLYLHPANSNGCCNESPVEILSWSLPFQRLA